MKACENKLKKQLSDNLETVTEKCFACDDLKKENYGTDAQVVEFGCTMNVAGETLLRVTCVTFAFRCPSFLKCLY
jgi:hypothetical protein